MNTCTEDLGKFRAVPGLLQKYYLKEISTGSISGFYVFDSVAARTSFWNSELAKLIPSRYGVIPGTLRVEEYEMDIVLNDEFITQ